MISTSLKISLIIIFLICILMLSIFPIGDSDSWWHLKTGEYIVQNQEIPQTDIFSYTAYGKQWITHEWLFEVLAYAVYTIGGLNGVILAKAVVVCLVFVVLLIFCQRRNVPLHLTVLFLLLIGLLSTGRFSERPQLFTFLFTAIFLLILYEYRDYKKDYLIFLPIITLFWANIHSGFVFGLGIATVFAIIEGLIHRQFDKRLWLMIGISYIVSLFNPNLHHAFFYPFWLVTNPTFKNVITELQSVYHETFASSPFVFYFHLLLGITLFLILLQGIWLRKWDLSSIALVVLFAVGTMLASRNRVLFGIVIVPVFAHFFMNWDQEKLPTRIRMMGQKIPQIVSHFIFPLIVLHMLIAFKGYTWHSGVRLEEHTIRRVGLGAEKWTPIAATNFIKSANLQGNMFNHFSFGGYLIWALAPERKVFIDGRNDVYGEAFFHQYRQIMRVLDDFQPLIDHYDLQYFVLRTPAADWYERPHQFIHSYLAQHENWSLVYFDDLSLIYARRHAVNDSAIVQYGYQYIDPLTDTQLQPHVDPKVDRDQIISEIERMLRNHPRGEFAHTTAANLLVKLGARQRAVEVYQNLIEINPQEVTAYGNLGKLYGQQKQYDQAITMFQKAMQLNRDHAERYVDLANAYFDAKRYTDAIHYYQLARNKGDRTPLTTLNMAICYRQNQQPDQAQEWFDILLAEFPDSREANIAHTYLNVDQFSKHYNRADSLSKVGDINNAIDEYKLAIHANPNHSFAHNNLGFLYWRKGWVDQALAEYQIAYELDSTNVDVLNNLGVVYGSQGDFEKARGYWQKVVAIDSTHAAKQNLRKLDQLEASGEY